jgi:phospholipase C
LNTAVSWKTFPERLEEAGVSWCVYQNEVSVATGLGKVPEAWLTSFEDNPLEFFTQYGVRFSPRHRRHLENLAKSLPEELAKLESAPQPWPDDVAKQVRTKRAKLKMVLTGLQEWTEENFAKLPAVQRNLHRKAFVTNEGDPDFRNLATFSYREDGKERRMEAPKGDLFHQFRKDVREGKLPTVSWLVAPENFSDHPQVPWYGAWYVSEALDVLTQNPEVWKETIFILCYDENDGYFDHVPPFVPPTPGRPETGKVSAGLDVLAEHTPEVDGHAGPVGLGYRVPLVIASPWSRGGYVCSQVFDHTSILQLLERVVSHKTGKPIRETNISAWRRTVCGDLTSVFRLYHGEKIELPQPVQRDALLESIHKAQFKPAPNGFKKLEPADIHLAQGSPHDCDWLPRQEAGVRPACALPYELSVDGALSADRKSFEVTFEARRELFGERAAGAPFLVYQFSAEKNSGSAGSPTKLAPVRSYAVSAGDRLSDGWQLRDSPDSAYHLRVHGPNGFYREFRGTANDPSLDIVLEIARAAGAATGNAVLRLANRDRQRPFTVRIEDAVYGTDPRVVQLTAAGSKTDRAEVTIDLAQSRGWHDLRIRVEQSPQFERRFAGRIETGSETVTDPFMAERKPS